MAHGRSGTVSHRPTRSRSPPHLAVLRDVERTPEAAGAPLQSTANKDTAGGDAPAVLNPQTRPRYGQDFWTHLCYMQHQRMATPCNRRCLRVPT